MGIRPGSINLFFLVSLLVALTGLAPLRAADPNAGGESVPKKSGKTAKVSNRLAVIRIHMEATGSGDGPTAEVIRAQPQLFSIEKQPFFDERDVAGAEIVETPDGGFVLSLDSTEHGRNALEMATVSSNGRHLVIYGQWIKDDEATESRWLAAPVLRNPLRGGVIRFSVDCDREEAQLLVDGLNNVAVKLKNQSKTKGDTSSSKGKQKKSTVDSTSAAGDLINQNTRK